MKNHKPVTAYYVSAAKVAEYILHVDGEIDLRDSAIISEIIADYGNDKLVQLEFSNDEIVYRINTDVDHSTENEKFIAALQGMEGVVTSVTIDLIQTTVTNDKEIFKMTTNANNNSNNAAAMPEVDFKKAIVEAALKQMESMNLDPEAKANLEQVLKGIAQPEVKQPAQEPAKEAAPDSAQSAKDAAAPKVSAEKPAARPTEAESIFTWKNAATAAKYVAGAAIVVGAVYLAVNHFGSSTGSMGSDTLE